MADQSLIRGAAAIAQSEAAKSGALGVGLAAGITPVVQEVVKFQEERKKKLDADAGLAAQYGLRMSKIEGVGPEQRKYLTNLFTKTRDELNEIAKDPDMPSNVKSAMMAELVQKSNDAVADNAELYGLAADANELLRKVGSEGNLSLSNAFDLNSEEYNIVKGLSADGYTVNNETGEIIINGKPVDKQKIQNALNVFQENMVDPAASATARSSIIQSFQNAKTEKQANDIINANIGAFNNSNPSDVKVMKKMLAETFGMEALVLKGIKDYKNALAVKFNEFKDKNFTPPVIEEEETGAGDIAKSYAETYLPKGIKGIKEMLNTVLGPEKISGYEIKNNQVRFISKFDSDGNPAEYSAIYDLTDKIGLKNTLKKALLASGRYYERDKLKINEAIDLFNFDIEKETPEIGAQDFSEFRRNPLLSNNTFISTNQKAEEPTGMEPFKNPFPTTFNSNQ